MRAEMHPLRQRVAELEAMRQAEAATATANDTQRFFDSFMSHNPVAAWIKDAHGVYVYVNKSYQQLLNRAEETVLGQTDEAIFSPELVPLLLENDRRVLESGKAIQTIESGAPLDGVVQSWLVCKFPLTDQSGRPLVGGVGLDITKQVQTEESLREALNLQQILLSELDHRVRNNLASLVTLIDMSQRGSPSVDAFARSIHRRVKAMATVHGLLSNVRWQSIDLRDLVHKMFPVDVHHRLKIDGQAVSIVASQATAVGMIIQELVSNSLKYGALSQAGEVDVQWTATESENEWRIELRWTERNGPTISGTCEPRVGTSLINGLVQSELRGAAKLNYPPTGATHCFEFSLLKGSS